ncbi:MULTISPECIES: FAD-dependent oxidoreductase [Pseudonocardia]|uniref:Fumarate reductase flavoprotein subunit n=1 Tax=Pseudonocardia autotrophica TaxID=2074 RepID=A0A1Y2MQS6_PSEAH|nr:MULTISPECIES: FAD-dependent oxidoreductase [Pseudonocardia]OSY37067.1 Fumarate reductase flavoprotein subunit precursor [Pseudonocardia autotrophica]TDN72040.1 succinate dehydrogenase/fumarate reductase flavoprotein subunit [Pseudonocardia autotrophica]
MDDQHATTGRADLLVLGGGMAGLSAAARAAGHGLRVTLVERGPDLGGSARYAGYLWTAATPEVMAEVNPGGSPELRDTVVAGFPGALDFVRDLGVPVGEPVTVLRYGTGHQVDTGAFVAACRRRIAASGEIVTGARTEHLLTDDAGRVTGAGIVTPDGTRRTVRATTTLLATGGFPADADLRAEHVHPQARDIAARSNPWSRGDGLRLALAAGARVTNSGGGFYGHLVPTGVELTPELYVEAALYYSEHAWLFNLAGERFVDESVGDHLTTIALVDQPECRGLLVTDARGYREVVCAPYVEGGPANDKFELARRRGARCVVADSAADFAHVPPEWGYDGPRIAAEIARLAAGGEPGPARSILPRPLDEPPYYVIETTAAITFPFAGIEVDGRGRVRSADGGVVDGLHAAGADAGGLYRNAYAGGLVPAVVLGLAAADAARDRAAGTADLVPGPAGTP